MSLSRWLLKEVNLNLSPEIGDKWMKDNGYEREYFVKENKRIKIQTQKDMARSFILDLKFQLGKADLNGLIIVVLQMEKLMGLLKFIVNLGTSMVTEFVKIFKGYCILEPIIRTECLKQDGPVVRISNKLALEIFGFNPTPYCDNMASSLYCMASHLNSVVQKNVGAINTQLLSIFKEFNEDLKSMQVKVKMTVHNL